MTKNEGGDTRDGRADIGGKGLPVAVSTILMDILKHEIRNSSDEDMFVFFELSTMRYRLKPGESFHFFYPREHPNDPQKKTAEAPPLISEFVSKNEMIIWINFGMEDGPYLSNGAEAETDYS